MTVYIKNFKFVKNRKGRLISFDYFDCYSWKHLKCEDSFNGDNVAVYSRFIIDQVIKDLCKGIDAANRNDLLKRFDLDIMCMVQLNPSQFSGATKLFM